MPDHPRCPLRLEPRRNPIRILDQRWGILGDSSFPFSRWKNPMSEKKNDLLSVPQLETKEAGTRAQDCRSQTSVVFFSLLLESTPYPSNLSPHLGQAGPWQVF